MRRWLREYWFPLVFGVVIFGIAVWAIWWCIAEGIKESKQGWHYHSTCEEIEVPVGDLSVPMWRCKGENKP